MNKVLYGIKIIIFFLMIILLRLLFSEFIIAPEGIEFHGLGEALLVLFIIIYLILLIKDLIKKEKVNYNKKYNILSICIFITIIAIILRCMFDPHFMMNNKDLLSEIKDYYKILFNGDIIYGYDTISLFFYQNTFYFNIMFIILFIYRKFNLKEDNSQ